MVEKLLNPRGYLSWTQISMWLTNPDRYISQYIQGNQRPLSSPSMTFGSKMAKAREDRDAGGDAEIQAAISLVPQYEIREYAIKETLKTQHGEVVVLGKLDSFNPETYAFRDDKTGMTRWTQRKAEQHKQLRHYAMLIFLKHGKIPREAWLDWLETEVDPNDSNVVRLTGHVQSFKVPITMGTVLEYMALVSKVAVEIDAEYRKYLSKLT